MSTINQTDVNVVKSVGNSWTICRSKSYAGRIYYFNTETGEAVWNLSDTDIEKAKKNSFAKQSDFISYPEPSGSPHDSSLQDIDISDLQNLKKNITPHVHNKQIRKIASPISSSEFAHINSINTIQFNIPVSTFYNPLVWNMPSQPVRLAPMNQTQPLLNQLEFDNVPVSNTPISLSNRFKSISKVKNTKFSTYINNLHNNSFNRFHKFNLASSKINLPVNCELNDSMDLRLLLCAKRRHCRNEQAESTVHSFENNSCKNEAIRGECDSDEHIVECDEISRKLSNGHDDYWLEENMLSNGLSNPIDTRAIRNVIGADENLDHLYIVTDASVLLKDLNFLNMLLYSDMQCHLVVPQVVTDEIESAAGTNLRTLATKAAYLISKHIESGIAFIDKSTGEYIDYKHEIINCCLRLIEKSLRVILLTNDENILQLQNETNIPMLSISETKKLACDILSDEREEKSFVTLNLNKESNIKITVDNDRNKTIVNDSEESNEFPIKDNTTNIPTMNDTDACHNDVGTDAVKASNTSTPFKVLSYDVTSELTNEKEDRQESTHLLSTNSNNNVLTATKKIVLKRCMSCDTSMPNKRKHYKWHRKREKSSLSNVSDDQLTSVPSIQSENAIRNYDTNNCNVGNSSCLPIASPKYQHNIPNYFSSSSESLFSDYNEMERGQNIILNKLIESNTSNNDTKIKDLDLSKVEENAPVTSVDSTDNNVMFEITSQVMEDCLKMKCDEWVSRFIQIMEEVLTQLLRRHPPLVYENMPPPWTLYEATECIKRTFHRDCDVVDAANKFCNVLFDLGGLRGKIRVNVSPQKYMEMYSYGVYLIDALQGLISNCEDLQTAAESLSKLLSDIQESNLDQNTHDSFGDIHDVSYNETANSIKDATKNTCTESARPMAVVHDKQKQQIIINNISPRRYKLRSQNQIEPQDTRVDVESTFFTCLHLQKNPISEHGINDSVKENETSADCVVDSDKNDESSKEKCHKEIVDRTQKDTEPKIVRNFIKCLDIEEKLKCKYSATEFYEMDNYDDEELDYEDNNEEYYENEYDDDEIEEYHEMTKESSTSQENIQDESIEKCDDSLKCIIQEVLKEAKEAFSAVCTFCKSAHDQFNSSGSNLKKNRFNEDAKRMHLYILQICSSLDGILKRETSNSKYSIQNIKEIPEFNVYNIDEEELMDYRRVVKEYLKKGNLLEETLRLLIDASKD